MHRLILYIGYSRSLVFENEKGLYDLNLGKRFPDAPKDHISYAAALVWGDEDRNLGRVGPLLWACSFLFQ